MSDYFKPWRRKIGVLTLVMSLVLVVVWRRSRSSQDELRCRTSLYTAIAIHSYDRCLGLMWIWDCESRPEKTGSDQFLLLDIRPMKAIFWDWSSSNVVVVMDLERRFPNLQLYWQFGEFHCGRLTSPKATAMLLLIPYWAAITSLNLLSAHLLLSKPRKKLADKRPDWVYQFRVVDVVHTMHDVTDRTDPVSKGYHWVDIYVEKAHMPEYFIKSEDLRSTT